MTDLYRFYDINDRLLYVGISLNAAQRASQHKSEKPWWPDVDRMTIERIPGERSDAENAERSAILTEGPLYNVAHNTQVALAPAITWSCEICGYPIKDGHGYIELPSAERARYVHEMAAWEARHGRELSSSDTADDNTLTQMRMRVITGSMLMRLPRLGHWRALHRACDPHPGSGGYWFDVGRARTTGELLDWTLHLMEKRWIGTTDWAGLVRRAVMN